MSQRRARNHCVIRTAFAKPRMGMPDVAICASDNAGIDGRRNANDGVAHNLRRRRTNAVRYFRQSRRAHSESSEPCMRAKAADREVAAPRADNACWR